MTSSNIFLKVQQHVRTSDKIGKMFLLFLSVLALQLSDAAFLPQLPLTGSPSLPRSVTQELFNELDELARVVDISYCVGTLGTGIQKPFKCAGRCSDFPDFELVSTWSTGQMLSDSCGYIALSHPPSPPRIILAFRGTYSMANTIADLSTIPQDYVPYPGHDKSSKKGKLHFLHGSTSGPKDCTNCTVHMGFMRSWTNTKPKVLPHVEKLIQKYPEYRLTLVGHSLGGAVAALASLDFASRGWNPKVTTFGEPRIGNRELVEYLDKTFSAGSKRLADNFRRVTHVDDPVPLLPLSEWGYRPHAGEIYISNPKLPPKVEDLHYCQGDSDLNCIAGAEGVSGVEYNVTELQVEIDGFWDWWKETKGSLSIPPRWRIWQLFFAHRNYFWQLGLCVPWLQSKDWWDRDNLQGEFMPAEL